MKCLWMLVGNDHFLCCCLTNFLFIVDQVNQMTFSTFSYQPIIHQSEGSIPKNQIVWPTLQKNTLNHSTTSTYEWAHTAHGTRYTVPQALLACILLLLLLLSATEKKSTNQNDSLIVTKHTAHKPNRMQKKKHEYTTKKETCKSNACKINATTNDKRDTFILELAALVHASSMLYIQI